MSSIYNIILAEHPCIYVQEPKINFCKQKLTVDTKSAHIGFRTLANILMIKQRIHIRKRLADMTKTRTALQLN